MTIKVNNRYKLSKEYIATLNKKPVTDLVKIEVMYGDIVTYSDGIDNFTDRVVNIIPNLSEIDFKFNVSSSAKKIIKPIIPEPVAPEPIEPVAPEPIEPVAPEPIEPVAPADPANPYADDYI